MGEDSSVCKTALLGFWWLRLTRSALALVVTVVAAVVVVRGLHLVLCPGTIELNLSRSNVVAMRYGPTNDNDTTHFGFQFYLEATNPSRLHFIYYRNITVKLLDGQSLPPENLLAEFSLMPSSLSLSLQEEQEYWAYGRTDKVGKIAIDNLFQVENGTKIDSAVMVLRGIVAVDNINQGITEYYHATFTCDQVTIESNALLPEPSSKNKKVLCMSTGLYCM